MGSGGSDFVKIRTKYLRAFFSAYTLAFAELHLAPWVDQSTTHGAKFFHASSASHAFGIDSPPEV